MITPLCPRDYDVSVELWEASVRFTHHFLSEEDILDIKKELKTAYFPAVSLYGIKDAEERLLAFIGISHKKVEMLFVAPHSMGKGLGKKLMQYAMNEFGIYLVDVNEQNIEALAFYEHLGFKTLSRDETDGSGKPYPILHLTL